ncbi:MAG TPA: ATP-dependent DNA ligase [Candidatus Saccharimonadia bacterium]|nr:ATP-dependent DNA ligase [Candidatus Saccharimonadia bacterium]
MIFSDFCEYLTRIESTASRLAITEELAAMYNAVAKDEIEPASWLLLGRLSPKYDSLELNFAEKMMMRVLSKFLPAKAGGAEQTDLFGNSKSDNVVAIQELYKKMGDLGDVAASLMSEHAGERTIIEVYNQLRAVAEASGSGSQEKKLQLMEVALKGSSPITAKYIVRISLQNLRLGFSDMTILDALSWAKTGDKSLRPKLELAYQMRADIGQLAHTFLAEGESALASVDIELGVPIAPALCQRLKTAQEMIDKMGKVYVEPKYDGTRVLIHISKNGKQWQIRTFTRNLEESSGMFPELKTALDDINADEVILDSEAVGYDAENDKLLPFQQTIQRKRKHDVEETASKIPLRFFVFDILYKDGKNLLHQPLHDRKKVLEETIQERGTFVRAPYIVTENADELRKFHASQLTEGLEGAVIKQYASEYQPGRRGWSWVKFKEEEGTTGKLTDTIDCVVMGYYVGQGKRTKFGIGAFLVGVRDEKSGTIRTIAKIGTGLSDEQWRETAKRCDALAVKHKPEEYLVDEMLTPNVWVRPQLVVEIAADEITNSPTHSAEKALRFPRLVKFRDDKSVEQATTLKELRSMQ